MLRPQPVEAVAAGAGEQGVDMIPDRMAAMQLVKHGGVDKLVYRTDVPVPRPGEGELLAKVTATAKKQHRSQGPGGLNGTFRLSDLHRVETYFADRSADFVGKIVVVPDAEWSRHGECFAL